MWYFWYTKYSVVDRIKKKNYLSTLYKLLVNNELSNALSQTGKNFTVFAPTDRAFERIADTVAKLSASQVKEVLLYHVHSGSAVDSKQAIKLGMSNTAIPMMQGLQATLRTEGKKLYINNAQVVKPDMRAYNGVVHIIDTVLVPPSFST